MVVRVPGAQEMAYTNQKTAATQLMKRSHRAVGAAVKDGVLQREPCYECGGTKRVEAHHPDYTKPLDVVWACPLHHRLLHGRMPATPYQPAVAPTHCRCGRPMPIPEPGKRGRRARYCGRCREERKALRFARAVVRALEAIEDPEWDGGERRG